MTLIIIIDIYLIRHVKHYLTVREREREIENNRREIINYHNLFQHPSVDQCPNTYRRTE